MVLDPTRQAAESASTGRLDKEELRQMTSGSAVTLLGSGVSAVAGLAIVLLLARTVDQSVMGVFAAATSLALIAATIARLGTPTTLVYFISRYRTLGPTPAIVPLVRRTILAVTGVSLVLAGTMWLAAPALGGLLASDMPQESADSLRVLALCLPAMALVEVAVALAEAFRRMAPGSLVDQTGRSLAQVALIALAAPTGNPVWLAAAWGLPYLPALVLLLGWDRRIVRHGPRPGTDHVGTVATPMELTRFSVPRWLSSLVQISMQRMDIILVAILAGPVEAAIYTAASRVIVLAQVVQQSLGRVVQPRISEALVTADLVRAQSLYLVSTSWLILLVWPILLVFSLLSDQLILIFSADYAAGAAVIPILCLTMVVATGSGVVDIVLVMSGRSARALFNTLIALVVMVGVDLWLVPQTGAVGAAWGWSAAILVRTALPLWQIRADLGMQPVGQETLRAAIISLTWFGALPLGFGQVGGQAGVWLGIAVGTVGYLVSVVVWRDKLHLSELMSTLPLAKRMSKALTQRGKEER